MFCDCKQEPKIMKVVTQSETLMPSLVNEVEKALMSLSLQT